MHDANTAARDAPSLFDDPLLILLLERAVNTDPRLEQVLVAERRRILTEASAAGLILDEGRARFLAALAQQCFLNEYVFDESAGETPLVERLQRQVQDLLTRERRIDHAALALLSTYRPLRELPFAQRILRYYRPGANDFLYPVIRLQLIAPAVERGLRERIDRLTSIRDPVSRSVRRQYELNPYPRWLYMDHHDATSLPAYVQRLFPHVPIGMSNETRRPRVLIAGCGTGRQAISAALRIEDADILALDLSTASLAFGVRMADELCVGGIRWAQGDILELRDHHDEFDLIECIGVLHHLDDPLAGWRNLCGLLAPDGMMRIGLYSDRARHAVEVARKWVGARGLSPTSEAVRDLRRHVLALPNEDPMKRLLSASDFYSTSECRDLVFHVREHRFSLPEIARYLELLELEFIGFEFPGDEVESRYRVMFPADPAMQDLHNWHVFERRYPHTFSSMYQFWVRKT